MGEFNVNKSDGSLEQTAGMPSEYPATQVMMSDGVTSVEEAVDELKNGLIKIKSVNISGTVDAEGNIGITNLTINDYPIAFLADAASTDVVVFFDGSAISGYQKYARFMTKRSVIVSGKIIYISGTITS